MTRTPTEYASHRDKMGQRVRELSAVGREIGAIPPVKDHGRKREGLEHYQNFCEIYFPNRFPLKWGRHHIKYLDRIDRVVKLGGMHAIAMPRGDGKTTGIEPAPIFAACGGWHLYSFIVGNSEPKAKEMLDSIKIELMYNEILLEDFPEISYPIKMLEGQARRAGGQIHHGKPTGIKWGPDELRLPVIPGSKASGATIRVAGIEGNIRGAVKTLPDGSRIRPTFAIVDDPQTDESARSPSQCEYRHQLLTGAIAGLSGAGETMSIVVPCTIIRPDDLSSRLLDRKRSPDFTGETTSMIEIFPDNMDLWDEYGRIRADSLDQREDISLATEFYAANRAAMDKGAQVAWAERYDPKHELSALQSAMNLHYRDRRAFFAEYQNDPLPDVEPDASMLTAKQIAEKTNAYPRGLVPNDATTVVTHIDVQGGLLYYAVCAFERDFTGYLIDYGAFPRQRLGYYTLQSAKRTFETLYPKLGFEGRLYNALDELVENTLAKGYKLDGGGEIMLERMLIDAAWGKSTDVVHKFARESPSRATLLPVYGRYVGASSMPMGEYTRKRGERVGHNWRIPTVSKKRVIRHGIYDTNYWKSFLHSRLGTPIGEPGAFSLHATDQRGQNHDMISEHLTAEVRIVTEGRGRRVDEWKLVDRSRDNHLFDNVVGCFVAASMSGVSLPEHDSTKAERVRRKVKLSEIQAQRRGVQ